MICLHIHTAPIQGVHKSTQIEYPAPNNERFKICVALIFPTVTEIEEIGDISDGEKMGMGKKIFRIICSMYYLARGSTWLK